MTSTGTLATDGVVICQDSIIILFYHIMTSIDIKTILFRGGDVVISAEDFSVMDIKSMAFTAKSHGAHLIIKNAGILSVLDCQSIAFTGGKGGVTFDFS